VAKVEPLSAAERARVLELYEADAKIADIVAAVGRSRSTVYSVLRTAGAKRRNAAATTSSGPCEVCGRPTRYVPPALRAQGVGRYCSRRCMGAAKRLPASRTGATAPNLLCTRCRQMKPVAEFYPHGSTARGRQYWCKTCCQEVRAERGQQPVNSTSIRKWGLQARYGIGPAEYDALYREQSGCCAICRIHKEPWQTGGGVKGRYRFLVVDHDHSTGRVRGLLCFNCNLAIGHFHDDPMLMAAAVAYMRATRNTDAA
jgi:Recombination endonuclease VII/Homeodomain-like domain